MEPTVPVPALSSPAEVDLRDLVTAESLLVALDFDGVLAPLQDDPDTSRMVPAATAAITELTGLPHTRVALVSGRDIATLRRLSGVGEAVWMIGSHGAEAALGATADTAGPAELTAAEAEMLVAIDDHLDAFEHTLPGPGGVSEVPVERKPFSRTVHTRGLAPAVAAALHEHATTVVEEFPHIRVIEGHDITELAVKQATKGDGVRLLARAGQPTAMVYLGDDVTDEDAFVALDDLTAAGPSSGIAAAEESGSSEAPVASDASVASDAPVPSYASVASGEVGSATGTPEARPLTAGLTVKVGTSATAAAWRIADPDAVAELLGRLARERAGHLGEGSD